MASVFTPEQREELKARIIGLVHRNKRMTMSQLERATGRVGIRSDVVLWMWLLVVICTYPVNTVFLYQNRRIRRGVKLRRKLTRHWSGSYLMVKSVATTET